MGGWALQKANRESFFNLSLSCQSANCFVECWWSGAKCTHGSCQRRRCLDTLLSLTDGHLLELLSTVTILHSVCTSTRQLSRQHALWLAKIEKHATLFQL